MSKSTLTQLDTGPGLEAWLRSWNVGSRVRAIVVHHTWSPTAVQYRGRSTIEGIRRYHMNERGWSDIGANLYAAPGEVVTGRPLDASNWAHAQVSLPRSRVEPEAWALCGGDAGWFNKHGIGIETVANFDEESTTDGPSGQSYQIMLECCVAICRVFSLDPMTRIAFHRDVADKSCPGRLLSRAEVRADLARRLGGATGGDLGIVRLGGPGSGTLIPCNPVLLNRAVWVGLRAFVESTGGRVDWQDGVLTVRDDAGAVVDVSAFCILAGEEYRCPLRPLADAVGWPVKDPPHLEADPPRVYVEKRPAR